MITQKMHDDSRVRMARELGREVFEKFLPMAHVVDRKAHEDGVHTWDDVGQHVQITSIKIVPAYVLELIEYPEGRVIFRLDFMSAESKDSVKKLVSFRLSFQDPDHGIPLNITNDTLPGPGVVITEEELQRLIDLLEILKAQDFSKSLRYQKPSGI